VRLRDRPVQYYVGRFRVPWWLFEILPHWVHRAADKLGGVE
jgi:hypothetical protein